MRNALRRLHRYLGLAMLALWIVQAGTGLLMAYHWELGDALIAGRHAAPDWQAIERHLDEIAARQPGGRVRSIYPTAGAPDRFDFFVDDPSGTTEVVRTNGAGEVLASWPSEHDYARAPWIETAVVLHQSLFAGHAGRLLIGVSGLLLLTNLFLGLRLAWPAAREWRRALRPPMRGPAAARLFGWHRAVGLWLSLPAIVVVCAGILMAFDDAVADLLQSDPPEPSLAVSTGPGLIGPARAVALALGRYPGATFSSLSLPSPGEPWYRVRVRQKGELRRVFGRTTVYVATVDGSIEVTNDALHAPWARRFVDACYPVHTGEAAGAVGRALVFATAFSVLVSALLGATLWWRRRRPTAAARGTRRPA
jgi:uncharacterized iron-regulated membrane protein